LAILVRFTACAAALLLLLVGAEMAGAEQASDNIPGRFIEGGGGHYEPPHDHISLKAYARIVAQARDTFARLGIKPKPLADAQTALSTTAADENPTRLIWPVRPGADNRNDYQIGVSAYIDHDAAIGSVLDYACGARTYDRANGFNHDGVDIASWPYPWSVMDADGLDVVAAADGIIVSKTGNQPDRSCTTDTQATWNFILLAHSDGRQSLYGHLKRDSLTSKALGETVTAGEYLGQVGSSGVSSGPHLHFQLLDANFANIEPFEGLCGSADTSWRWQPDYNRPRVNAVMTGSAAPEIGQCDGSEFPAAADEFSPGDVVFVSGFLVNQPAGQPAQLELIQPDGSLWLETAMGTPQEALDFAYWFRAFIAPDIVGEWRARVSLNGEFSESGFVIGQPAEEGALVAAVLPGSRSVTPGQSASIFATIVNGSEVELKGCRVLPLGPFAGQLSYQTTSAATNELVGEPNKPVTLPPGGAQSFVLTLEPTAPVAPSNVEFNFKCNNAPRARIVRGVNTLQFSSGAGAGADIIPITATADGDGVVRMNGPNGIAAFGTAAVNISAPASGISVLPVAPGLELNLSICETTIEGACKELPSPMVLVDFADAARTFSVFVAATGEPVAFDPANNRVELRFQSGGEVRGLVSVAVTTVQ